MSTTITRWGNSSGIRIPSKVLGQSRFKLGDLVDFVVNANGNIEIVEPAAKHRRIMAPGRVSAAELYGKLPVTPAASSADAWPSDGMVGKEWESWSS